MKSYAEYKTPSGIIYRGLLNNDENPTFMWVFFNLEVKEVYIKGLKFIRYLSQEEYDSLKPIEIIQREVIYEEETLRIREDVDLSILETFGFIKVVEDIFNKEEYYEYEPYNYIYILGHSRRGQYYYIGIADRYVHITATEPDGSGGSIKLSNILFKMWDNNIFEK